MAHIREPTVSPIKISDLRPTQITVGLREVEEKRKRFREKADSKADSFIGKHMIPALLGLKGRYYVIDHHHLARALHEEGVKHVLVAVVADLSHLEKDAFWTYLDNREWAHPYDDKGVRRDYDAIPKSVDALTDDPYRSLAGSLRRVGGFAKDTTPFSEFLWADFMRRQIKRKLVEDDFDKALADALKIAKSQDANFLPGWCGPTDDD